MSDYPELSTREIMGADRQYRAITLSTDAYDELIAAMHPVDRFTLQGDRENLVVYVPWTETFLFITADPAPAQAAPRELEQ